MRKTTTKQKYLTKNEFVLIVIGKVRFRTFAEKSYAADKIVKTKPEKFSAKSRGRLDTLPSFAKH